MGEGNSVLRTGKNRCQNKAGKNVFHGLIVSESGSRIGKCSKNNLQTIFKQSSSQVMQCERVREF